MTDNPLYPGTPKIDPLVQALVFMAVRLSVTGLGLTDSVHINGLSQDWTNKLLVAGGILWMVVAKIMDHFHKKALANAVPGTVKGA